MLCTRNIDDNKEIKDYLYQEKEETWLWNFTIRVLLIQYSKWSFIENVPYLPLNECIAWILSGFQLLVTWNFYGKKYIYLLYATTWNYLYNTKS